MQKIRIFKLVISVFLFVVMIMCFTFNVVAANITMAEQEPQIIIDGKDRETAWIDSEEVSFDAVPEIGGWSTVDMVHYKNTVYGLINFYTDIEGELDFVLRVDFHYKKNSVYILFVMSKQLVFYSDSSLSMEGMCQQTDEGYCAEFSFSVNNNILVYGDLIQIEIKYGAIDECDNYENVYGFMGREQYDFYVGGQLIETPTTQKTTKPNSSNKTTAKKKTTVKATQSADNDVDGFSDGSNTDNSNVSVVDAEYFNNKQTVIIIAVMMFACLTMMIIFLVSRRNEDSSPQYTDEDKGCD